MPRREDLASVMVIGSGPIVIGQAAEFDYSGTQACRVLREEGLRVVLVNSNPATIMTDPGFADATYVEPITPEVVEALLGDDRLDHVRGDRLDVGGVGEPGVGHDRGGVGVDQHHAQALLAQHPAGLGARVVELRRLPDDDRPRPDQEDGPDVSALGHGWSSAP